MQNLGVKVSNGSRSVSVTKTGLLKVGTGKAEEACMALARISKGEARKVRKALRRAGYAALAGAVAQRRFVDRGH